MANGNGNGYAPVKVIYDNLNLARAEFSRLKGIARDFHAVSMPEGEITETMIFKFGNPYQRRDFYDRLLELNREDTPKEERLHFHSGDLFLFTKR